MALSNLFSPYKLLFITLGLLLFYLLSHFAFKEKVITIGYVSQMEIMSYEKERLSQINDPESKELFFGKPELAADLIAEIAKSHEAKGFKVVFSNDVVYGANVISLSEGIYNEVIEKLQEAGK